MSTHAGVGRDEDFTRERFVRVLAGVGCIAGAILMVELALTRIFSVTMYYHFAFLAISIALFGLSASGVRVRGRRRSIGTDRHAGRRVHSLLFAAAALVRALVSRASSRGLTTATTTSC